MAELVTNEWAAQFVCPRHGRCTPAMVSTKKTCLWCDQLLIRQVPPGPLREVVVEPETLAETHQWLIEEVDADQDSYDLLQDGQGVLILQTLAEVEAYLSYYGSQRDEIIFRDKDGFEVDHDFRDPPRWGE